jgi:hypothetical protein
MARALKRLPVEDDVARTHFGINAFILAVMAAMAIGLVTACENAARGLANDAGQAARTVGAIAADASEQVAARASALKENVDVKGALMADASVDASRINVDVSAWTRTIRLNGSVSSVNERGKAEAIARARAEGYTVVNNIAVLPRR